MVGGRSILAAAAALAVLMGGGLVLPNWANFLLVIAFAKAMTALGLIILLRSGVLSFGQGLFYCAGAYGAGLLMLWGGVTDAIVLVLAGVLVALAVGVLAGLLLAGYRRIFFATLTLALSMLVHGALTKADVLGGSDGLNLHAVTFLGWRPSGPQQTVYAMLVLAGVLAVVAAALCRAHFDSGRGLLSLGVRDNEIRVEYLGASAWRIVFENFSAAAGLAGLGGALNAIALGHIDPELAFWTTSGEFVFVAILAGYASVSAVFAAAILLELVRSYSSQYFPNAWQMTLGIFMLAVIIFLPSGLGSLLTRRDRRPEPAEDAP